MDNRSLRVSSSLFMASFVMVLGFWSSYSLFAPIPRLSPVFAQMIVNWDGPRLLQATSGIDFGRHWLDIPGFPLLVVSSYIVIRLLYTNWTLWHEAWGYFWGGIVLSIVLALTWLQFGYLTGLTLMALGFGGLAAIACLRGLLCAVEWALKRNNERLFEAFRRGLLFWLLTIPTSLIYLVGIANNGLYGYILLVLYVSVLSGGFLLVRGFQNTLLQIGATRPQSQTC